MRKARNHRLEELFQAAIALEPDQRESFLDRECADDPELKQQVEQLLAADASGTLDLLDELLRRQTELLDTPLAGEANARSRGPAVTQTDPTSNALPRADSGIEGTMVGAYRITKAIGRGGMGVVYEAVNDELETRAVIKILHPHLAENEQITKRFVNEARAAARIEHPAIVDVFDIAHRDDVGWYIVMEFLDGENLASMIRRSGKLSENKAMRFVRQIAGALSAAHRKGIIHRDLKPANIFIIADPDVPGGERIKLLDFGIAKMLEGSGSLVTHSGLLMGTPTYMSPEQCRGADKVDPRSDLYALGVIAFEMMCGRPPFIKQGFGDYIIAHATEPIPSINQLSPDISADTIAIIEKLLAKNPAARFASAKRLLAALADASRKMNAIISPCLEQPE